MVSCGISGSFWSIAESVCISVNLGTSKRIRQHLWWRRKARHQLGCFPACCIRTVAKLALGFDTVQILTWFGPSVQWVLQTLHAITQVALSRFQQAEWLESGSQQPPVLFTLLFCAQVKTRCQHISTSYLCLPLHLHALPTFASDSTLEDQSFFYRFPPPINPDAAGSSCYIQ